jgi:hypothetical protein
MSAQTIAIIGIVWTGVFSIGSGVFQALNMPAASKVCGTLFALDIGRIIRWLASRTPAAQQQQQLAKTREALGRQQEDTVR